MEIQNLREALAKWKYPNWAINKVQNKYINSNWEDNNNNHSLQEQLQPHSNH